MVAYRAEANRRVFEVLLHHDLAIKHGHFIIDDLSGESRLPYLGPVAHAASHIEGEDDGVFRIRFELVYVLFRVHFFVELGVAGEGFFGGCGVGGAGSPTVSGGSVYFSVVISSSHYIAESLCNNILRMASMKYKKVETKPEAEIIDMESLESRLAQTAVPSRPSQKKVTGGKPETAKKWTKKGSSSETSHTTFAEKYKANIPAQLKQQQQQQQPQHQPEVELCSHPVLFTREDLQKAFSLAKT